MDSAQPGQARQKSVFVLCFDVSISYPARSTSGTDIFKGHGKQVQRQRDRQQYSQAIPHA